MTILFFARRFYPLIGGVEKHVLEISKRLVKKGHKVVVITEYEKNTNNQNQQLLPLSATIEGIEIMRVQAGKEGKLKKFRIWLGLFKYLGVIKVADIVHCHDIFYWYLPFRFLFPFKRVYTTFHGYEGNKIPDKKAIFMHKLAEKLSYGNICVGDYLKKWYGTKPTLVTYGAVDENLLKHKSASNKQNYFKDIIFIGRLEEEAGIMKYLKVLAILRKRGISLNMDVFGEGSQKNEAIKYSTVNKLKVEFKGSVKSIESVLNNYGYVFCSRYIGTLEAMAFRKLVFVEYNNEIKKNCFDLSPFKDFIVLEESPLKLANIVVYTIENSKFATEKTNKGYEWVRKQTWDKLTNQYIRLWSKRLV